MTITKHYINGLTRRPLLHVGTTQTPSLIVIHYSVTDTAAQAVTALNAQKLGYHILIEKNGAAFQTRPFTQTAAHPGLSNWKRQSDVTLDASVSRNSVGICLMNKGYDYGASKHSSGKLIYNADDPSMQEWETYPPEQIAACGAIVAELVAAYPITDVVGHQDVAILGKFDPGPLFDLQSLKDLVQQPKSLGFKTRVKSSDGLKLRKSPRMSAAVIKDLPDGTDLHIRAIAYGPRADCIQPSPPSKRRYLTKWASVGLGGKDEHAGFVHMSGLDGTPLSASLASFL